MADLETSHATLDHTGLTGVGSSAAADVTFDATGLTNTSATDVQAAMEDFDAAITSGGGGGSKAHEIVAHAGNHNVTSTSFADVDGTNDTLSITTAGGDLLVSFLASVSANGGATAGVDITVDGTRASGATNGLITSNAAAAVPLYCAYIVASVAAGAHTVRVQAKTTSSSIDIGQSGSSIHVLMAQEL